MILKRIYEKHDNMPVLKDQTTSCQKHIDAMLEVMKHDPNMYSVFEPKIKERIKELEELEQAKAEYLQGVDVVKLDEGSQHISSRLYEEGLARGWFTRQASHLVIHSHDDFKDYVLSIERTPGYYCCFCNKKLEDGAGAAHVKAAHGNAKSPDTSNPAGYRKDNFFTLLYKGN